MDKIIKKIYSNINYNTSELISNINLGLILTTFGTGFFSLGANLNNAASLMMLSILNMIYYIYSEEERLSLHTKDIIEIRKLYNNLIKDYNKLNKIFDFQNPVEIYTLYNKMLYAGYLSKDKEFHFGKDKVKDITTIQGTNIINGEAVCRHIATMLKEIYNAYGIEGNTLTVYQSDFDVMQDNVENMLSLLEEIHNEHQRTNIPFLDLVYQYEEELNKYYEYTIPKKDKKLTIIGNHKITTAVYQGDTYYLDPTQSRIYKPSSIKENILIDTSAAGDIHILPKQKKNKKVLATLTDAVTAPSEDKEYIDMTTRIYSSNKDIIEAYYQSQKELYSDIAEELSKIKVKRKTK